jgi:hypothetical protein
LNFHHGSRLADLRANFQRRFDLAGFQKVRKALDPRNILGNTLTDSVLQA